MAKLTRRSFLQGTAAGLAATILPRNVLGANDKLCHAAIGSGGMGGADLRALSSHPKVQIVALCDVDANRLKAAAARYKVPREHTYADWREMLHKEGGNIDSVNVSVPDHTHAAATMTALRLKKHVYCQKPLCHDVYECRKVAAAAKAAGVVTQLGTQAASRIGDRMTVHFLRSGVIGKAKRAVLCSNRPGAIERYRLKGPRPAKGDPVPPHLSWDLWLGTAPERPFANGIYHPVRWRAWQDFGTGWSGDIGCHIFDAVWKGLRLTAPKTVIAEVQKSWLESPARRADNWPQGDHITWVFPASDATDGELVVEWFDGKFYPPDDVQKIAGLGPGKYPPESSMVIGTEGAILTRHGSGPQLFPKEKFAKIKRPKLPGRDHYHHFVNACLGGEMTESHFMQTGPMAETVILGTVAIRVPNTLLEWDAPNLKITNSADAQRLLRRTYRKGWEVEGL